MRTVHKIAAYLLLGTLALASKTATVQATSPTLSELPTREVTVSQDTSDDNTGNNNTEVIQETKIKGTAFVNVDKEVIILSKPDEDGEAIGKISKNDMVNILETEEDWYLISSGSVTGYIKSEYLITGEEAKKLLKSLGTTYAKVNVKTLRVRQKASIRSKILTRINKGNEYKVQKQVNGWVKISVKDTIGYVKADYVSLHKEYDQAISLKSQEITSTLKVSNESVSSKIDSLRDNIVSYAMKFLGNPYVWGGTSLTRGADCSGFTQSVFKDFGIRIPRTSRTQATGGKRVSLSNLQPGDLIFYTRQGRINHVALYIGNGKVIGARSPRNGIQITKYNYRTPYKAVRYIS